jgi:hypothetical protein
VAHEPHRRHHVELERGVPVGVVELVERLDLRRAGVVDEDVDGAARALGDPLRGVGRGHVDPVRAGDPHHARALRREQGGRRRADPARGACHHGRPSLDAQVHAQIMARRAARVAAAP